jgi:hypothetical protein
MASGAGGDDSIEKIKSQEFGALWLANLIDQEIGLAGLIDSVISRSGVRIPMSAPVKSST